MGCNKFWYINKSKAIATAIHGIFMCILLQLWFISIYICLVRMFDLPMPFYISISYWLHKLWFALCYLGYESSILYHVLKQEWVEYNYQSKFLLTVKSLAVFQKMSTVYKLFPNPGGKNDFFLLMTLVCLAWCPLIFTYVLLWFLK